MKELRTIAPMTNFIIAWRSITNIRIKHTDLDCVCTGIEQRFLLQRVVLQAGALADCELPVLDLTRAGQIAVW